MSPEIPAGWKDILSDEIQQPYYLKLQQFIQEERRRYKVYPPEAEVFNALHFTPYDQVKVLLLGQDPYHGEHQAHGLSFSVRPGAPKPPSLKNIFKELKEDLGCRIPNNGYLAPWAEQGVLLLNAVLTVRAGEPNSHKNKGWERFTDQIIRSLSARRVRVVFLLWGGYAQKKTSLIDASRHVILTSAHPSPLSAQRGFFGSRPFSKTNDALKQAGISPIDWQIPDL